MIAGRLPRRVARQAARSLLVPRRTAADITITRTGKPILSNNGGRSSLGGHTATVFGATGQLGRYIVNRLARRGCTVVIPFREEMAKRHLKVAGDLGRVIFCEYDLFNTRSLEECVRHSDMVFNLVGRNYSTKNYSLMEVHVVGAERLAMAVAKYDCDRFIHVSSYNADPRSPSHFYSTKGYGEQVVRRHFPETTIVRPAPMFGHEDKLLNRLASATNVITSNFMRKKMWPVHVVDVGKALETIAFDDSTASQTYELFGPREYSMADISHLVNKEILKNRRHVNIPKIIMRPIAMLLNRLLWWPVGSEHDVDREFIDQKIDSAARTFSHLGISPDDIKDWTYTYVQGYRSSYTYDDAPQSEKELREARKYLHVLDDQ